MADTMAETYRIVISYIDSYGRYRNNDVEYYMTNVCQKIRNYPRYHYLYHIYCHK